LKQRMMADIIGALSHNGTFMQITTHSDYFLRRLNELIIFAKAHKAASSNEKLSKLSKNVDIIYEMSIDDTTLGAYLLQKQADGTSKAIRQNLTDGIPFSSFREAIIDNINKQDYLEKFLQDVIE